MADEDVKIRVSAESDTGALERTKAKIRELRIEAEDLRKAADKYGEKYGFDDSRAKSARTDASVRESEANRLERPFLAEEKTEQRSARNEKAKHLREQRAEDRTAAADERAIKREMHQEETRRQRFGRVAGGVAGGMAMFAVHEILSEITERQGIALRDKAARTMNARGLAVGASWRATSGQVQSDQFATEQRMDEREANRAEVDRAADAKTWQHGLAGMGSGAAAGAAIGSIVPVIGTAIGAIAGGIIGAVGGMIHGRREGSLTKAERDAAQKRDAKLQEDQKNLARKKFVEEDGGIELDLARHRAERSRSGQRASFVDEQKKQWRARYIASRDMAGNDAEASELANLEMETRMRDRQVAAGASLVTTHSGAGDIAAAAAWGGMSTPGMSELRIEMAAFHQTVKSNSAAMEELHKRQDQSVK